MQKILNHKFRVVTFSVLALLSIALPVKAEEPLVIFNRGGDTYDHVQVRKVISADTIILEDDQKIKLIGVKAPQPPKKEKVEKDEFGFRIRNDDPTTSIEEKSFAFARQLLEDQYVRVEFDHNRRDENFYTVGYVFLKNGTLVNAEIIRQGFAEMTIRPPNLKYADQLREAYREARDEQRGLQGQ